jgi:hypothetical protein
MALSKTTTASANYITSNAGTVTYAFTSEPIVADGVLTTSYDITKPGVFTAGTASENTLSKPTNESHS